MLHSDFTHRATPVDHLRASCRARISSRDSAAVRQSFDQRAQAPVAASAPMRMTLVVSVAPGDELRTTALFGLGLT